MHPVNWRMIVTVGLGVPLLVAGYGTQIGDSLNAQISDRLVVSPQDKSLDPYQYMGATSCNGSACHGSTKPKTKFTIQQNEYWVWLDNDSHAKAYEKLTEPDSHRMGKNLGISKPETSPRCLVCHAVDVDKAHQGSNYDLKEGVTCEGCHGPAEKWLGPHTRRDWDKKKGAEYGMFDTKNLIKRAERCLACHLGVDKNIVDHELIGAGHPRLNFELDTFSTVMPSHWLPPKEKNERDWWGARAWAVGQATSLRNQVELLSASRKSRGVVWPDLIHFDCYACHHNVVDRVRDIGDDEKKIQRWRVREYGGKPGRLIWNASSYTVFRHFVRESLPEKAEAFDQVISSFHDRLSGKASMAEFEQSLSQLEQFSKELVPLVEQKKFTQKLAWSLMRRIAGDGPAVANAGFQSAEQATLALASLYDSYADSVGAPANGKAMKGAIDVLYEDIKAGRQFDLPKFTQHLAALRKTLEPESPPAPAVKSEPKSPS